MLMHQTVAVGSSKVRSQETAFTLVFSDRKYPGSITAS